MLQVIERAQQKAYGYIKYLSEPSNINDMALYIAYLIYAGARYFHFNEHCTDEAKCNFLPTKISIAFGHEEAATDAMPINHLFYLACMHCILLMLSALKVMHFL